jgi:hypothetical protein
MDGNRVIQQVTTIFTSFMVLFYLGAGIYLIFYFDMSSLDKSLRVILGSSFLFYGLYRAYRAYVKIVEVFFTKDKDND